MATHADDDFRDHPLPVAARIAKARHNGGAVTVLSAAMLAVGDILEPEKSDVEMVQPADDRGDDGLDLTFGELPPLD